MLHEISVFNFKSYREASITLAPLTLLIGANASGKSNLIEGIRFLNLLATGRRLPDIFASIQRAEIDIRGRPGQLSRGDEDWFGFSASFYQRRRSVGFAIRLNNGGDTCVVEGENIKLEGESVPVYELKTLPGDKHGTEVKVSYNNFARGGKKPMLACSNQQAIFTQLGLPSRFQNAESRKTIPSLVKTLEDDLRRIIFLDPQPAKMRGYAFRTDNQMMGSGSNVSAVLATLCADAVGKATLLDFIRALPEQDIEDIGFLTTQRNEVMVQLKESFGGVRTLTEAALLSDGTLRVLAVGAALLSAPEGSLVIVEEVDNGIHPSRVSTLLQRTLDIAKRRQLKILLSSHNPALLDALPREVIPAVTCCYRDPKEGDSRLIRLQDLPKYPELIAQGPLGQLMTRGILEQYLKKPPRSTKETLASVDAWLNGEKVEGQP